jgi:hypothetical protein
MADRYGGPAALGGLLLGGLISAGMALPAAAQDVRVTDIKAALFLEHSGKLSDDILSRQGARLVDLPLGTGEFGEPGNLLVFTVTLAGAKNTQPKFAAAIVNIAITGRTGQKRVEKRALEGFVFGESGTLVRPVVIENITCSKVEIEVKTQRSARKAQLAFTCNEPKPEPKPAAAPRR